jgi:peptide/nickel transport system substrate-binding protein
LLSPASLSPHRALLSMIRRIEVQGSERVDFLLEAPDPLFPAYLGIGILPADAIEADHPFVERPIGSGGFRVVGAPEPGRLRLERRRDAQAVEVVTVKDPSVRVMKLLRGEVDLLQNDLSPELVGFLQRREGVRVSTRAGSNFSYLGFNLADQVTALPAVRQAVAHGIDRPALLRHLFQGRARAAEMVFPPDHWAGHPALQPHAHDPERSRRLLAGLGYGPDNPLELGFKTTSDPFRVRLATAIQSQLERAGIRLRVRSLDWGTFFGDVKAGRFQLYGLTWVGIRIPDIFRYAFHSASVPPDGANRGRYSSAEADRLIGAARAADALDRQAGHYRALQERLHADLPYVPLWFEDQVLAARSEVRGYVLAPDGNYDALEWTRLGDPERDDAGGAHA